MKQEFFKKYNLLIIIIITTMLGFSSGLVGEIVARSYWADSLPLNNLDFTTGRYSDQGLVITNPKNVIVQQDTKISETVSSVAGSLAGIYKKQKNVKSSKSFELGNFYKINEPSGQGFILTADGWIATAFPLVKNFSDYVVITKDKKIYQIDKAVADSLTGFNFIHVPARDLAVRQFAENQSVRGGQLAIVINSLGLNLVSSVSGLEASDGLVRSSDNFSQKLFLNDSLTPEFNEAAVFNLAGETLGLADDKGQIEPINHLADAAKNLFKNKTNLRASLGINYINLADLVPVGGQSINWQKGVIISKDQKSGVAVKKNSPADKAGLREGDIIISIDGVSLNGANDLADIIQNHLAGETVNLAVLRGGEERTVEVVLAEMK